MTDISKEAQLLLDDIINYDGIETRVEWYEEEGPYKELLDKELIELGPARGPDRAWKRATAITPE